MLVFSTYFDRLLLLLDIMANPKHTQYVYLQISARTQAKQLVQAIGGLPAQLIAKTDLPRGYEPLLQMFDYRFGAVRKTINENRKSSSDGHITFTYMNNEGEQQQVPCVWRGYVTKIAEHVFELIDNMELQQCHCQESTCPIKASPVTIHLNYAESELRNLCERVPDFMRINLLGMFDLVMSTFTDKERSGWPMRKEASENPNPSIMSSQDFASNIKSKTSYIGRPKLRAAYQLITAKIYQNVKKSQAAVKFAFQKPIYHKNLFPYAKNLPKEKSPVLLEQELRLSDLNESIESHKSFKARYSDQHRYMRAIREAERKLEKCVKQSEKPYVAINGLADEIEMRTACEAAYKDFVVTVLDTVEPWPDGNELSASTASCENSTQRADLKRLVRGKDPRVRPIDDRPTTFPKSRKKGVAYVRRNAD